MRGELPSDASARLYFSEPVDIATVNNAVTIRKTSDSSVVAGKWSPEQSDVVFNTTGIVAGGSYSWTVNTSMVADLLGKKDAAASQASGAFTVEGSTAVRDFKVQVEGTGSTLKVTATWLPPVNDTGVTGYTVTQQKLDSNFALSGSSANVANDVIHGNAAKYSMSGDVSGFAAGDSYRFVITANGTGVTDTVEIYAVPETANVVGSQLVSILSDTAFEVGAVSGTVDDRAKVTIKPGDLKQSTKISVAFIDNANLEGKDGGGTRYSDVIQLGPDGAVFNKPVGISMRVDATAGLTSIASSCATTGATCVADLLRLLNPLTFDTTTKKWTKGALTKDRVEILGPNAAILHGRTPHFSSFVVAQAFSFAGGAPANNATLSAATVGQTTYVVDIPLTGTSNLGTNVNVTFNPNTVGFTAANNGTNVRISNANVLAVDGVNSVQVTVQSVDASVPSTETRVYTIPVTNLTGDANFAGTPVPADSFSVFISAVNSQLGNNAVLTWSIASDTTSRTIDSIIIGYQNLSVANSPFVTFANNRAVTTTNISVTPNQNYRFKIWTKSAQGNRSAESKDLERFTFGVPVATNINVKATFVANTGQAVGNLTDFQFVSSGNGATMGYKVISAGELNDQTKGVGKLLVTSKTLSAPFGTVEFLADTFLELSFNEVASSVSYVVNSTGTYAVYHYKLNTDGTGAWEELPTALTGGATLAGAFVTNADDATVAAGRTRVTISKAQGATGSPFVVGPKLAAPVVIRSGGGGCAVPDSNQQVDPLAGVLNFLLMLLPLGLIGIRKLRS